MFATVAGVPASPPTSGLVASAVRPVDDGDKWTQGIAWVPERCGTGYQLVPFCDADDPEAHGAGASGAVYYQPPAVRFALQCSTMGGGVDVDRVRRMVDAATPYVVARELWTGELAQDEAGFPVPLGGTSTNLYLASADATTVGGAASSAALAIGALEAAALEESMGERVMIHLPPSVLPLLGLGQLRRVGNDLLTMNDNLVVVDAGYPGTGPAGEEPGATVWAYATSLVSVRLSSVQIEDSAATVDPAINLQTVWANRVFAATYDPCVHFATEITRE